jgi:lipoprotein signal peptidase
MLDRLINGGVRDWLVVPVLGLRNNLADWAIIIAIAWYGIIELHHERTRSNS